MDVGVRVGGQLRVRARPEVDMCSEPPRHVGDPPAGGIGPRVEGGPAGVSSLAPPFTRSATINRSAHHERRHGERGIRRVGHHAGLLLARSLAAVALLRR